VAFVTYVHEVHAQFAKEAMACQSLDNDEILNVRWATEDPNPTQKVAEKRRLEDMGQEAIRARMDPRIVDAMRAVRALEDGDILTEGGVETKSDAGDDVTDSDAKRIRLEVESASDVREQGYKPNGLLTPDTLEGLKYFAEIRRRNGYDPGQAPSRLGLVDYASDEE
jgi:hypothetical protein